MDGFSNTMKVSPEWVELPFSGSGPSNFVGNGAYSPVANAIYYAPGYATSIAKFSLDTYTWSYFGTFTATSGNNSKWQKGLYLNDGKIYYAPSGMMSDGAYGRPGQNPRVLVIDTNNDTYTTTYIESDNLPITYYNFVLASNGYLYATPGNASGVLKYNPATGTGVKLGSFGLNQSVSIGCAYASNGKVYSGGSNFSNFNKIIVCNTTNDSVYTISVTIPGTAGRTRIPTAHPDGYIYCMPNNTTGIVRINPANDALTYLQPTATSFFPAQTALNGRIYTYGQEYNPATDTLRTIGKPVSDYSFMLAPDGDIYTYPWPPGKTTFTKLSKIPNPIYPFEGAPPLDVSTVGSSNWNWQHNKL